MFNLPARRENKTTVSDLVAQKGYMAPAGPVVLDLTQHVGRIFITVSPTAACAEVTVGTTSTDQSSVDMVEGTTFQHSGIRLEIQVPSPSGQGSGGAVFNNISGSVFVGGHISGRVVINGVDMTPGSSDDPDIETRATLPPGSWVKIDSRSAVTEIRGRLDRLEFGGASGKLSADHAHVLDADISSGSIHVGQVTGEMDVQVSSGSFAVDNYEGSSAKVRISSGSGRASASSSAYGIFDVRVSSGSFNLFGSRNLDVRRRSSSGSVNVR